MLNPPGEPPVDAEAQVGGDESDLLQGGGSVLAGTGPARLKRDFDPARLSIFLRAAGGVMMALLGEQELARETAKATTNRPGPA